jgi:hypothetical protein
VAFSKFEVAVFCEAGNDKQDKKRAVSGVVLVRFETARVAGNRLKIKLTVFAFLEARFLRRRQW